MIEVIVDQNDLKELKRDLEKLNPKELISPELEEFAKKVVEVVREYPDPVAGFERTGKLGASWIYTLLSRDNNAQFKNDAYYAGYVQGEEQRHYHKEHGWKTILDVIEDETDKLIKKIYDRIGRIWK